LYVGVWIFAYVERLGDGLPIWDCPPPRVNKSKKDENLPNAELRASVASSEGEYSLAKFVFVFFVLSKPDIPGTHDSLFFRR
jgi:hypothetical protein